MAIESPDHNNLVQGLEVSTFKDFLITQTSSVTFGKRRLLVAKKINTG